VRKSTLRGGLSAGTPARRVTAPHGPHACPLDGGGRGQSHGLGCQRACREVWIGVEMPRARSPRESMIPLVSGRIQSRTITSQGFTLAIASPAAPAWAMSTTNRSPRRRVASRRAASWSESTIKRRTVSTPAPPGLRERAPESITERSKRSCRASKPLRLSSEPGVLRHPGAPAPGREPRRRRGCRSDTAGAADQPRR
jgi:hypothetical protein